MKIFLLIFLLLLCHASAWGSLLTKSEDFTKAATYGMNMATYSMEKTNGKEAAEKLLTFDIIWDVMGKGEEFFLNGDPNAFPKFKDDVLVIKLVLDKVGEVATKVGAGEYDAALIASVDAVVGKLNHPVVNALWEATKLTYESHKLVKSSKAALQIETLYGVVNHDRRLIGSSTGDAPALIPIDSDTVTYFYNKYLITDATSRELVKAYVKTKLGEVFPEISTTLWEDFTGASQVIKEEYELQQLQEFENNSRRWIRALLLDLNIQVQKQWAETRFAQEAEKFKIFSAKFGKAFANMNEIIAYYTKLKNLEKQKALFPAKLEELRKIKTEAETKYPTADYQGKLAIRGALFKLSEDCNLYAVNSMIINESELEKQFVALQIESLAIVTKIDKELYVNKDTITKDIYDPKTPEQSSSSLQSYESSVKAIYKPFLEKYSADMSEYSEVPAEEVKVFLSSNNLEAALKTMNEWTTKQDKLFSEAKLNYDQSLPRLYSSIPPITSSNYAQRKEVYENFEKSNLQSLYSPNQDAFYYDNRYPIWDAAEKQLHQAFKTIDEIYTLKYNNDRRLLTSMTNYFIMETIRVSDAVYKNRIAFGVFQQKLYGTYGKGYSEVSDFNPESIFTEWLPPVAGNANEAIKYLNGNRYTNIGKISDDGVTLNTIGQNIAYKKGAIIAPFSVHNGLIAALSNIDGELYRLDTMKKEWENFPILDDQTLTSYNDLAAPTKEEAEQRAAYFKASNGAENNALRNLFGKTDGYKQSISKMTKLMNSINTGTIKSQTRQYLGTVDTELNNRQRDYEYLEKLEKQWERWYAEQIKNNILILDRQSGKIIIGAGFRQSKEGNYAILDKPYGHYALANELISNDKAEKAKNDLAKLEVYDFIQNNMSNTKLLLNGLFNAQGFKPAPEENFLIGEYVVWKSALDKAEKLLGDVDVKKDASYLLTLVEISALLPYTVTFPELTEQKKDDYASKWQNKYGKFNDTLTVFPFQGFVLGDRFIQLRLHIQELIAAKGRLTQTDATDKWLAEAGRTRLAEYLKTFNVISEETGRYLAQKEVEQSSYDEIGVKYWDLRNRYEGDKYAFDSGFTAQLAAYEARLAKLSEIIIDEGKRARERIETLYATFKNAYEAKNDSGLLGCLGDEWSAGDGTTLADVQDHFRNMFTVFDQIQIKMSGIQVESTGKSGGYRVSYNLSIVGNIFADNLKHEEKSSVVEEVAIDTAGRARITSTPQGRFWLIE